MESVVRNVEIEIEGFDLPDRSCDPNPGEDYENIHAALMSSEGQAAVFQRGSVIDSASFEKKRASRRAHEADRSGGLTGVRHRQASTNWLVDDV